ncbi:MAG: phosphatase PAP2 family protein [Patescibacteria group bacterium]|nr:phosphatase PAP2 family protein [Patescibacteria group bacterium]MDE2218079.1 phosphatase PAP2 family protein [Patescibacteria group bacterium]
MNILIIFGAKYLYLAAIAVALVYFLKQPREIKKRIIIFGLASLPITYLVAKLAGHFYYDPRPFAAGNFTPLIPHADDNGFPSDHTLILAAIASVIYPFSKKASAVLWMLAFAVGFSRVFAGVHHSIDIFGSMIIAAVVSVLTVRLLGKRGMV